MNGFNYDYLVCALKSIASIYGGKSTRVISKQLKIK